MSRPSSRKNGLYIAPHAVIRFMQRVCGIPVRTLEASRQARPDIMRRLAWLVHQAKPLPKEAHMIFARLLQEDADDLKRVEKGTLVYLHHPSQAQAVFVKSGDAIVTTLVVSEQEIEWLLGSKGAEQKTTSLLQGKSGFDYAGFFERHGLESTWATHAAEACECLETEQIGRWKSLGDMANVEYFQLQPAETAHPYPIWEWKRAILLGERLLSQKPKRVFTTPNHLPVLEMAMSGLESWQHIMLQTDNTGEVELSQLGEIVAPSDGALVCVIADQPILQGLLGQIRQAIGTPSAKQELDFRHMKACRIDPSQPPEQAFTFFSRI